MHKCIHIEEAKNFFRSFYIGYNIFNNMYWDITELCPFENGWVNFIVLKANFKAIKWYIFNQFWNSVIFSKDVIFQKNTKWRKKIDRKWVEKNKVSNKMAQKLSKKLLLRNFYKTETCKESKFLLLSNLDCKKYIYAIKVPFNLSRSRFKDKLFSRIFLGLTV